jgi:hypothetical protein
LGGVLPAISLLTRTPRRASAVVGWVASALIDRDEPARSDRGSAADCEGSAMTQAAVMSCHK